MEITIRCWPALTCCRIPTLQHGIAIAHAGRCIYDGLCVEDQSHFPNRDGFRLDVLAALTHLRIPFISWPGAAYGLEYHWKEGVRKEDARRLTTNTSAQQLEPHSFNTDSFLRFCSELGAAPSLRVNTHTGSPQEARDWVEYCNFTGSSSLAEIRMKGSAKEFPGVAYWDLSAPPFSSAPSFAPLYAEKYCAWSSAMKAVSPEIQVSAGPGDSIEDLSQEWFPAFLQALPPAMLPDSFTVPCTLYLADDAETAHPSYLESYVQIQRLEKTFSALGGMIRYYFPKDAPSLAVNHWCIKESRDKQTAVEEESKTLYAALVGASFLHALHRQSEGVSSALFNHALNVGQCLAVTEKDGIFLTPLYHVFDMMRPHRQGRLVTFRAKAPTFTHPHSSDIPLLDVCASLTGKKLYVTVINRSQRETLEGRISVGDATISSCTGRVLKGESLTDENNMDAPSRLSPRRQRPVIQEKYFEHSFPPLSLSAFSLSLTPE